MRQFRCRDCELDYKAGNFRQISHIGQKFVLPRRRHRSRSIFTEMVRPPSACSGHCRCQYPAFKQNKSTSAHHPRQNDPVTRG